MVITLNPAKTNSTTQSSTSSQIPSLSASSQSTSSSTQSPVSTSTEPPTVSEIIALSKHASLSVAVYSTLVKTPLLPAGINPPENENPSTVSPPADIKKIKLYNKKVGISLNPETSLDKLNNVLDKIDLVLIMSVNPGFGGQKFIENTLNKIKKLRLKIDQLKLKVEIEVDGGINFENSKSIIKAGADILVSGTTIFKSNGGNIKKNIEILKNQ